MQSKLVNLKAELAKKSMSQVDLASLLEMNYCSLNNKLNGITKFTVEEAFKICDILNCNDVRTLFTQVDT